MNEQVKDDHHHTSDAEKNSKDNPIPATDASRNEERDRRVKEEQDTERLRSERESVQEKKPQ